MCAICAAPSILGHMGILKGKKYTCFPSFRDDSFEGEEILIQGVIDCLVMNGRNAVVIDYKTDRVENMAQLYEKYSKQLEMYRFAAESLYETDSVKCIIYSFYLGEYMEF